MARQIPFLEARQQNWVIGRLVRYERTAFDESIVQALGSGDFNSKRVVFGTNPSRRNTSCASSLNDHDAASMWQIPSAFTEETAVRISARAIPLLRLLGSTAS